jgi:transposase
MKEVITMNTKEANRIAILEKVKKKEMKQNRAAKILGLSVRQIRRLGKRYKEDGPKGIIHQLRGLPSNGRIDGYAIDAAVKTIREKYYDFGPTFAHEKLVEKHGVTFSRETLRKAMILDGIWHPKRKKTMVLHPLRDRRNYEGELVQVDGSPHTWFESRGPKCTLLVYIDDATGKLLWLAFVACESTAAYFTATKRYLLAHGKPVAFYVDKHGVFRVNTSRYETAALDDTNGLTQFGRAMHQLDIEVIFANSAEAKGRVEKVNQTLQDRLVKELRLQGISTMEEGNLYLPAFMKDFNNRFAVTARCPGSVHRPLLPTDNLDDIFCQHHIRVLSKQLTVSYQNMRFQVQTKRPLYAMQHAKVTIKEDLKGTIVITYKGKDLSYTTVEQRPKTTIADSKTLNLTVDQLSKGFGIHITPMQLPTPTTDCYVGQPV